jgi:hypothetical protein
MGKSSENKRNLASLAAWAQGVHGARQELAALRDELGPLLWLGERLGGSGTTLVLQKQPGMDALPVKVTLTLPPGARVLSERVHPQPARQAGASLEFDLALDQDQQIKVEFVQSR